MMEYIIYLVLSFLVVIFYLKNRKAKKTLSSEISDHADTKNQLTQSETKREYFKNLAFKRGK